MFSVLAESVTSWFCFVSCIGRVRNIMILFFSEAAAECGGEPWRNEWGRTDSPTPGLYDTQETAPLKTTYKTLELIV